jgi:alpha-methylacyl-CoA racemase
VPGPLTGTTIIELAGIGPGPFAGMMLADMGAEVIRVERPGGNPMAALGHSVMFRSRRSIAVDLKQPAGAEVVLRLVADADAIFEGFRPGVAERLGVGPDACLERNPRLVYGRMTGWGQDGPLAPAVGHDINYIALSGALHAIGRAGGPPVPPLNLVGDFGGGGMLLAYGMVCALLHAARTGEGQVVDAAMVDGSAALMAMFYGLRTQGLHTDERGTNLLDTGAPFYDVYETADGQWVSLGPLEPQFFDAFCSLLDLDGDLRASQGDLARWPELRAVIAERIAARPRAEWDALLLGTDACYAPVLSLEDAPAHPHNRARGTFVEVDGGMQPAPAPRFTATPPDDPRPDRPAGADTRTVLQAAGFDDDEIARLSADGAIGLDEG